MLEQGTGYWRLNRNYVTFFNDKGAPPNKWLGDQFYITWAKKASLK